MQNLAATILIAIACLTGNETEARITNNTIKKFPPHALREDFAALKTVLENVHIGLYRYSSKRIIDSLFSNCLNQLTKPLTEIEFFRLLSPVIAAIRDEHMFILPSENYWKKEIGQTVYSQNTAASTAKFFPFFVKIIDNRLFIDNNLSDDTSLKKGDESLSINGKPVTSILPVAEIWKYRFLVREQILFCLTLK